MCSIFSDRFDMRSLTNCPVCNGTELLPRFTARDPHYGIRGEYRIVDCAACGLRFVNPMYSDHELASLYPRDYYAYGEAPPPVRWKARLKRILGYWRGTKEPQFAKPGTFLDLGCGSGEVVERMRESGWDAQGVEISYQAAARGRSRGLRITSGTIQDAALPSDAFDYVRASHSFEHITCPDQTLDEIYRILKADGTLLLAVPNINSLTARLFQRYWWHLCAPVHPFGYSVETLSRLLERHGFNVSRVVFNSDYVGLLGSFQIWLNRKTEKKSFDGHVFSNRLLRVFCGWIEKLCDILKCGDMIELLARKAPQGRHCEKPSPAAVEANPGFSMKIAFVGAFAFSPKGTMRARAHPLAAELVRLGHEVTIFLPPYDNIADCGREWDLEGVRIVNVGMPKDRPVDGSMRLALYSRMFVQLLREIEAYRPDVLHVFKPKGFAGAAGTYFLLRHRPVVLDCDDWEGWGGWNDIKRYPWIVKEYIDRQERWLIRSAWAVTVGSHALADKACESRQSREQVFYIPNCGASPANRSLQAKVRTMTRDTARRHFGFDENPILLYSGHFEDRGSVDFFCRAAAPVVARHHACVVFVGDSMEEPMIREKFPEGASLRFLPRLGYEDFLRVIWACDVAAFPYPDDPVHRAKCSARITDYMAMSRPVLTSAVGQNAEYIVDNVTGLLARPGQENDFAAKLDRLLSDSDLREKLGENAVLRMREKFSWAGAVHGCLAAYECALSKGKQPDNSGLAAISARRSAARSPDAA
jgi:glycosyltransferase involved in cell wall biosynthesis/SAM-dependent methyltransferase